jgi:osmotically-inducible protein OsmY
MSQVVESVYQRPERAVRAPQPDAQRAAIEQAARCRLGDSSYRALSYLRCEYHEGVLTLRGHLPSFFLKQMAQELVARVGGVEQVANRVEVLS